MGISVLHPANLLSFLHDMILAVDVAYPEGKALAGGVLFNNWQDEKPQRRIVISCPLPDKYMPGQFYRRELPCISTLLRQVTEPLDCIVIDGFVFLGRERLPGLGKRLYDLLRKKAVIIGVAKTPFRETPESCELLRGGSMKPLYITAAGITVHKAKSCISSMHGKARIPTLLRDVDRLCRAAASDAQICK